jgi:hypothetical protein
MDDPDQTQTSADPVYSFKPSLMGAACMLRLTPDALSWTIGRHSGRLPYRDIASMRMSFRPVGMQTKRYLTEIRAPGTPKIMIASASWKSMVEQERRDKPYADFIAELHRRVAASGAKPRCTSGIAPFLYWPGVLVFIVVLLGLASLIVRALQVASYPGALFVAAFFGLFAWQLGHFFKLNKPARYEPDAPPAHLLPRD